MLEFLGPSLTFKNREKNSSNHRKNSSLSSPLRFAQSILSEGSFRLSVLLWFGGYPLEKRLGGGGRADTSDCDIGSMSGREVRGTTGGGELTSGVKVLNVVLSGRDLRDVAGGGPWTLEAGMLGGLMGRDGGGGGEADDDEGGARFQFGSQLVLEAGMLEYLSLVFTTLATPASLAFSALALSSATVKGTKTLEIRSQRRHEVFAHN